MEGSIVGTELPAHSTSASIFYYKTHVDLSSRLIEECLHGLTEKTQTEILERMGGRLCSW